MIPVRDRYRQELAERAESEWCVEAAAGGIAPQAAGIRRWLMRTPNENQHRVECDGYAAQLRDARDLLDNSERTLSLLDRTSKLQAGEIAAMGVAENRCKAELRDSHTAYDNDLAAANAESAEMVGKVENLTKRYVKLKDAYHE